MKGLVRAVLTKLAGGAVMVWVVASFTFFLVHALPGSPGKVAYEGYLSQGMSPDEAMAKVAVIYGYTSQDPLATQYVNYVSDLVHGNLGLSISYSGVPVSQVIGNALPWTLIPILSGLLISFAIGTTAGVGQTLLPLGRRTQPVRLTDRRHPVLRPRDPAHHRLPHPARLVAVRRDQ
ncbi:hypothetical protein ACMZ5A_29205 [Bacillus mobilis]|uniref:hypothetical protein n=1 Tax=Bacillus mobilis TaxID=2026190 RepID=UPI0039EEB309